MHTYPWQLWIYSHVYLLTHPQIRHPSSRASQKPQREAVISPVWTFWKFDDGIIMMMEEEVVIEEMLMKEVMVEVDDGCICNLHWV